MYHTNLYQSLIKYCIYIVHYILHIINVLFVIITCPLVMSLLFRRHFLISSSQISIHVIIHVLAVYLLCTIHILSMSLYITSLPCPYNMSLLCTHHVIMITSQCSYHVLAMSLSHAYPIISTRIRLDDHPTFSYNILYYLYVVYHVVTKSCVREYIT